MGRFIAGALKILADLRAAVTAPLSIRSTEKFTPDNRDWSEGFLISTTHQDAIWFYERLRWQAALEPDCVSQPPHHTEKLTNNDGSTTSCVSVQYRSGSRSAAEKVDARSVSRQDQYPPIPIR